MPYITIPNRKFNQISLEDILFGVSQEEYDKKTKETNDTKTVFKVITPAQLTKKVDINALIEKLKLFNIAHKDLEKIVDKAVLYSHFKIPKRSGGLRQIDAPSPELYQALRELKFLLENYFYATHHTAAFAYITHRNTITALQRHQANDSRWFLKLDFHNFFGSTTFDFVMKMLSNIFPFSEVVKNDEGKSALEDALSLCFLNGGLPQGTPISPMLTNLVMIPIDYTIAKFAREYNPYLCYTRYADDIILSSKKNFLFKDVEQGIVKILEQFDAPFQLNKTKTRYGSRAGQNWNLGLMLNKDNVITIGNRKKKLFKVMLYQFCNDYLNHTPWSMDDTNHFRGLMSYYTMVEPETTKQLIKNYEEKFNISIKDASDKILHGNLT